VVHFGYVPFADLLPRLAAFVHHGGIGTTSQALRAGVPQLIRPMAYDQLDNSRRAQKLGVAIELLPSRYDAERAAEALDRLLRDSALRQRCMHWASRLSHSEVNSEPHSDSVRRSCDLILESFATGKRW
jgi:UDP:flavonoid glycosyltransferase YjiC (YdhE family)